MEWFGNVLPTAYASSTFVQGRVKILANAPRSRENTHKLFKRSKRLAELEFNTHFINLFEICGKRRKMVWVIPLPGWRLINLLVAW